ncbi:MAG: thioredoxin fold domain-containing protein [SAR324 cluster bacterium]|nr:thioredoxin fold domain-containing protein [SAR324 cluster bacterium]
MKPSFFWAALALLCCVNKPSLLVASMPEMPIAKDLKTTANQSPNKVVVLYFTAEYCMYCQALDWEVLVPVMRSGEYAEIANFQRVQHDEPETKLTDFDGSMVSSRELIQRCKVNVTPTLIFLGPNGHEVASPLVGFLTVDFYGAYLDQSLEDGRAQLFSKTN